MLMLNFDRRISPILRPMRKARPAAMSDHSALSSNSVARATRGIVWVMNLVSRLDNFSCWAWLRSRYSSVVRETRGMAG